MGNEFKKAPVIEAVFEIRFPAELSIECRRDEYYEEIRKTYSNISLPVIDSPEPNALRAYRFETEDKTSLIQFSINRFSFHSRNYKIFNEFSSETLKYLELFCNHYKISQLKRTGLRYINHIPIEMKQDVIPLSKYLKFGYNLPNTIPENLELFHTILLTKMGNGKLRILIASQEKLEPLGKNAIILDFDFFFEGELDIKNIKDYLEKSHIYTKSTFESLLSDEYINTLKEVN